MLTYLLQLTAEEAVRSNSELSPDLALKLVQETASATMRLLSETNMSTAEIIRRVAVPGGMTESALGVLSQYVPRACSALFRETARRGEEHQAGSLSPEPQQQE